MNARLRKLWDSQPPRPKRGVHVDGDGSVFIALPGGFRALIDPGDIELVAPFKWRAQQNTCTGTYYVCASQPGAGARSKTVFLHRVIMGAARGQRIDHRDGNTFDNRRSNLRPCTNAQNIRNSAPYRTKRTSRLKGVYFNKQTGKFRAQIMHDGRKINLGSFIDEVDAARAYDAAARRLFGEFSRCNFPAEAQC